MNSVPADPIFTNSQLYRDIAKESLLATTTEANKRRRLKTDGSSGHIITYDPEHRSFKQSMIAIVFAGMYIEAQLWLSGCNILGRTKYKLIDKQPLEQRVVALGIIDKSLLADLKAYREMRKALVHEKPIPASMETSPTWIAQTEAVKAIQLMDRLEKALAERVT